MVLVYGLSLVYISSILSRCQDKNQKGDIHADFFDSSLETCYNILYFLIAFMLKKGVEKCFGTK